jgi:hypothetical protein
MTVDKSYIASLARGYTDKCIEVVFGIMTNKDVSHRERRRAAEILFNHGRRPLVELLVDIRKAFGEAEAIRRTSCEACSRPRAAMGRMEAWPAADAEAAWQTVEAVWPCF